MWFVFGCSSDGSYSDYRPAQAKTGVFDRCVDCTLFLCTVRNTNFILSSIHSVRHGVSFKEVELVVCLCVTVPTQMSHLHVHVVCGNC